MNKENNHTCCCRNCKPAPECPLKDYIATKKENVRITAQNRKLQKALRLVNRVKKQNKLATINSRDEVKQAEACRHEN